jgi:hypothetical protein
MDTVYADPSSVQRLWKLKLHHYRNFASVHRSKSMCARSCRIPTRL